MLINAGDIYNELYYIYKDKYNKKINSLDTENKKKLNYKKLRLSDDYQYPSEEEQEETKTDMNKFSKYIVEEETDINHDLFKKYFYYDAPIFLVKELYKIKNKEKSNVFVNITNSGLKDLKEEIKVMSKEEKKKEKPDKIVKIVEEILKFNK